MTKREIAALSCKLLGIYAALSALSSLQSTLPSALATWQFASRRSGLAAPSHEWWLVGAGFAPSMALLCAVVMLWLQADFLALLMTRDKGESTPIPSAVSAREWQAIGLSLFGVWELLQALNGIGMYFYYLSIAMISSSAFFVLGTTAQIIIIVFHFLLGCAFLLGARRLSNILKTVSD